VDSYTTAGHYSYVPYRYYRVTRRMRGRKAPHITATHHIRYVTKSQTRSHPEMVGDVACDLELWFIKNSFCAFL